jgi:hypothetical protein
MRTTMPAPVDVAHSLHGATVKAPARWFAAPYRGMPATVVFPVVFLSTSRFTGVCSAGHANPAARTTPNWFPPDARTPADGVLVLWTHVEIPSDVLNTLDGRPVRINGHLAPALRSSNRAVRARIVHRG